LISGFCNSAVGVIKNLLKINGLKNVKMPNISALS
jgi:hypothetical protein